MKISFCFLLYLTFGTQGNSFIINVDAGSILDTSLANDVIDSAELSDDAVVADGMMVEVSSSVDVLLLLLPIDPSSLDISESNAGCLVKL